MSDQSRPKGQPPKERELDRVKKEVRSTLIPFQNKGCTVKNLEDAYLEQIGKRIPYIQFGYADLETFLMAMPDVVSMHYRQNPTRGYILKAVFVESTQHIQKLVSKQKGPSSSYEPKNFRKTGNTVRRGSTCTSNVRQVNSETYNMPNVNPNLPPRLRIKPVPNSDQLDIKELISTYPDGLDMSNFERAYKHNFGYAFNHATYGFLDLKECLDTLASIGVLTLIPDKSSYRICAFDPSKPRPSPSSSRRLPDNEHLDIKELISTYPDGLDMSNFERAYKHHFGYVFNLATYGFLDLKECLDTLASIRVLTLIPDKNSYRICAFDPSKPSPSPSSSRTPEAVVSSEKNTDINETLKMNFRHLLAQFPNGLLLNELPREYERIFKLPLNCSDYGYRNALDLVGRLKDVFHMQRPAIKGQDWILFDSSKPPPEQAEEVQCASKNNVSPGKISPQVKLNVETLLLAHPDGIRLDEFQSVYERNCKEELPWRDLGYDSITTFFLEFDSPVQLYPCKSGNVIVAHESLKGPRINGGGTGTIPDYLVDYILPGTDYKYLTVTVETSAEKCIEVYVSQINDPEDFWIQLRGLDTTVKMEKFYAKLQTVYNESNAEFYAIPERYLGVNMVCAVLYPEDNGWHRGKITSILPGNIVQVFFVDYGTVCQVEKQTLRFLRKDFMHLPAQAIKARLANLKPVGQYWSRESKLFLMEMCCFKPLLAKITDTTFKSVVSIQLVDTSGEDDINVNLEFLSRADLAQYCADDDSEILSETQLCENSVGPDHNSFQLQMQSAYLTQLANSMNYMIPYSGPYSYPIAPVPEDQGIVSGVLQKMVAMGVAKPVNGQIQNPVPERINGSHSSSSNSVASSDAKHDYDEEDELEVPNVNGVSCQEPNQKRYCQVKSLSVNSNSVPVHLINFGGKPYMTSGDISATIMWKTDMLKNALRNIAKLKVPSITIYKKDCANFFKDLEDKKVAVSKDGGSVHLFPLESVKKIIPKFYGQSEEIVQQLELLENSFDSSDPYWTDELNGDSDAAEDDAELKVLIEKRCEILQRMMLCPKGSDTCNREFQDVERQIKQVAERKESLANPEQETKHHSSSLTDTPDRRVQPVRPNVHQTTASVPPTMPQANPLMAYGQLSFIPVLPSVNIPPGFMCYPFPNSVTQQPMFVVPQNATSE